MALQQVAMQVSYIKWTEVDPGTILKCFYIETKIGKFKGKDKETHYVETPEGNRYGLSGNANLDRGFKNIRPGWYVEITYKGMITLSSGENAGTECHQFEMAFDDERIHPLFSGDAAARKPVEYKESSSGDTPSEDKPAPTLVKPDAPKPAAQPAESAAETPSEPAAAGTGKKRSIF